MCSTDPQGLYDQKDKGKIGAEWRVGLSASATILKGLMKTRKMAVGTGEGADWKGCWNRWDFGKMLEFVGLWEESDMSTGQGAEQLTEGSLLTVVSWVGKDMAPWFLGKHQKNLGAMDRHQGTAGKNGGHGVKTLTADRNKTEWTAASGKDEVKRNCVHEDRAVGKHLLLLS